MGNESNKEVKTTTEKGILNDYVFKQKLGHGSFAIVKLAVRKSDNKKFAIKIIQKKKLSKEELVVVDDEVKIMRRINHPNIVKLEAIYNTPSKLYMVLELLTGGELFDRIVAKGQYNESQASNTIRQVTEAVQYLHSRGIVHRDLKPENLLYSSTEESAELKITDFGLAKYIKEDIDIMSTACGTPGYVAPEVLMDQPYDHQIDIWSIGVILYILLCGFPPFYNENTSVLYSQIKGGRFDFPRPYWDGISESAKDLVLKCLTVNPRKRITTQQILMHSWIAGKTSQQPFSPSHGTILRHRQLRRRLRRGVNLVRAINRLLSGIEEFDSRM